MLRKSKTIQEIYNEAEKYDLVITNDAPLATALNKLIESPRLDYFALTPRQIASKYALLNYTRLYSKTELILEITKITKQPLKIIHQYVEKIFDVWNNTAFLDLTIPYLTQDEISLLKYFKDYPCIEYAMEDFDEEFFGDKKLAVIGQDLFNELDNQILPKKGAKPDEINILSDSENKIEKTYIFNSGNDLLNETIDLINNDNEDEIAIVLNTESEFTEILKSRLNSKGINLQIKTFLSEDISVSNLLSLIESSFEISDLKLKNVLFLESMFDLTLNRKCNLYYFSRYVNTNSKDTKLAKVFNMMLNIEKYSFEKLYGKLKDEFNTNVNTNLIKLTEILGISGKKINEENVNLLKYFLEQIDLETDQKHNGVLFVNSLNSAFIDRPVVIYLGLDESWCRLNMGKKYIEKLSENLKNLNKFQILLSQGEHKYFFVTNHKKNASINPCYYFNILADNKINGFENKFFNPVFYDYNKPGTENNFLKAKITIAEKNKSKDTISQSSLNTYFICPKKYSYSKLVTSEDKTHFLKGNLLHEFAEFYFNYPDYSKKNFDRLLNLLLEKYKVFIKEGNEDIERTVFKIGMTNIMNYLDNKNFVKEEENYSKKDFNQLFESENKKKIYSNTEYWFFNYEEGLKGKIDLISGQEILDYKSGRGSKDVTQLLKEFRPELLTEKNYAKVNFQTVTYFAGIRNKMNNSPVSFIYFYLLSDMQDVIKGKSEFDPQTSTVTYIPETFKDHLISETCFENFISHPFFDRIGYDLYREIIIENFDDTDFHVKSNIYENLEDAFFNAGMEKAGIDFKEFGKKKENRFREDIIQKALDKIYILRTGEKTSGYVFKDDIDNFVKLAKEKIDEITGYEKEDFPNSPFLELRKICKECEFLNMCIRNKLWSTVETE